MKNNDIFWKSTSIFLIALVIMLPFYSADAMAANNSLAENVTVGTNETSEIKEVDLTDKTKPVIDTSSLQFPQLGKFVGEGELTSDIKINVTDENLDLVFASSKEASLNLSKAACKESKGIHECVWNAVKIVPTKTSSVTISITAVDTFNNSIKKTVSKSLTPDNNPPQIISFGTQRQFNEVYFAGSGSNKIVLKANDIGSGIDVNSINVNLGALGSVGSPVCDKQEGLYTCVWTTSGKVTAESTKILVTSLKDLSGNKAVPVETEVFIDLTPPLIEKVEIVGVVNNQLQGGNQVVVKATIAEENGLIGLINMNNLINDAKTKFPKNDLTPDSGWQVFSEDNCQKDTGVWNCDFITEPIKKGAGKADIEIKILDTGGNKATWVGEAKNVISGSKGKYKVEYFGVSDEANPDFWEVGKVIPGISFIDLDTTSFTYSRMPFTVQFKSSNSAAKMLSADIIGCTPGKTLPTLKKVTTEVSKGSDTAENVVIPVDTSTHESQSVESEITNSPAIARSLVFGKVFPGGRSSPASMQLVLELEPFDGKEFSEGGPGKLVIPYTCNFNILSKVGNNILLNKEIQPVNVEVTFGFSELGAVNQNLEEMIAYEKEAVDTGFWGAIGTLNTVLTWIGRALNVYNMIQTAKTLYKAYSMGVDTFGTFPGGDASVASFCFGVSTFEGAIEDVLLKELETPIQILSCKITPANFFYGKWVETVLSIYNLEIGKSASDNEGLTGKESATRAKSVKDNLFLSLATVCVPGLIQGLDRLRQIKCRKISCLENEVANNVATVQMCNQLENRQICKYVVGDLWYAIPFTQLWDKIVGIFSDAFNNILSFARVAIIAGCGLFCWVPKTGNSLHVGCLYAYYGLDILKFIDSMVSFGYEIKSIVENEGGLNYCDSVLEEKKPDSPKETPSLSADAPKKDG